MKSEREDLENVLGYNIYLNQVCFMVVAESITHVNIYHFVY